MPDLPAAERLLRDIGPTRLTFVSVHTDVASGEELPLELTNTRAAFAKGVIFGGIGGLILGLVMGLAGVGPSVDMTCIFGLVVGAVVGALGATLIGVSDPDARLEKLVDRIGPGELVMSIRARSMSNEEELVALVKRHGGEVLPGTFVAPHRPQPVA